MIIAFLGESINSYREDLLSFLEALELVCSSCSSPTYWHGWYKRFVKGEAEPIPILRVRCRSCGRTDAVIPDFLSPFKHYAQPVRQKVIEQAVEKGIAVERVCCDNEWPSPVFPSVDAVRRWIRGYRKQHRQHIGALVSLLERYGYHVRCWKQGFHFLEQLIRAFEQLTSHPVRGSCLLGRVNILLAISQFRLWI